MFKFEKYQRALFRHSSSDSVATLKKIFLCLYVFFKKKTAKKVEFWSKQDKFYQCFSHFNKKNKFSVSEQKLVIQYNHIKYSTSQKNLEKTYI